MEKYFLSSSKIVRKLTPGFFIESGKTLTAIMFYYKFTNYFYVQKQSPNFKRVGVILHPFSDELYWLTFSHAC